MKWLQSLAFVAAFLYVQTAGAVTQYGAERYSNEGVTITLGDPIGSVYRAGEDVEFSIRTDNDAYVIVFDIDTDGFVHLLYPPRGENLQRFSSQRAYELPQDTEQALVVGGAKGIEFVFAISVEDRDYVNDEELRFLADDERLPEQRRFRITGDPLLGANTIASQVVRGISHRSGVTMAFTYFYIDEAVDFPRYLCEDCYEKGQDPYASGMPTYVANADFDKTDHLTYPLDEGFVPENQASSLIGGLDFRSGDDRSDVTKVYVSYYPRWDDGFYDTSWWYCDPWYWDPWYYYPYPYRWGWGVSIGWGWGWTACHYPYYWGAYPPCGYGWGYPVYYPPYYYPPYSTGYGNNWRSFRPVPKGGSTSGSLYAGMNYKGTRDAMSRRFSASSPKGSVQLASANGASIKRSHGTLKYPLTGSEPRVIRSRPTRSSEGTGKYLQGSRKFQPKSTAHREQRVISRTGKSSRSYAGTNRRAVDTRGLERKTQDMGRRAWDSSGSRVDSSSRKSGSRSGDKRAYSPNSRRDSSSRSAAGRSGSPTGGRSSPRGASQPSSRSSSHGGGSPHGKR
jgi:hypothetical protein